MKSIVSANHLREQFLRFFESKGHRRLASASLIPQKDPTLLLTGAGMVPFKPYFLGAESPPAPRLATCQRCLRTPDIENVGRTDRHATFFEMLGNFSFGDYFKEEAIQWAWQYVNEELQFSPSQLWVSIYEDDDEAFQIWNQTIGVPAQRIVRLGKADNFWEIGVGPCGPCSEIYFDRGEEYGCGAPDCRPGCDCDRFLEFWNLVFIQFHQDDQGRLTPLEHTGIDTGMGLERVAVLKQGVRSIFEIDTIRSVLDRVAGLAATRYGESAAVDESLRVITDHIRGIVFLVHDGVLPANEGRGYILRRLLRRAVRHGRQLGIKGLFLNRVADMVFLQMNSGYPELKERREAIEKIIGMEEERFAQTLEQGMELLQQLIDRQIESGQTTIPGEDAFKLYDTFGFPIELTREIAMEHKLVIDDSGFQQAMELQRQRARAASGDKGYLGQDRALGELQVQEPVVFVGYEHTEAEAEIVAIIHQGNQLAEATAGQEIIVVVNRTPFYAEGGGQVSDTGVLTSKAGVVEVTGVLSPAKGIIAHQGRVVSGKVAVKDTVLATVYENERKDIERHHTATHLLHHALREELGQHVAQAGSYVDAERLRFDFSHFEAVTAEQLEAIEFAVNQKIRTNFPVETEFMDMEAAKAKGAMALFGEKYDQQVRVVSAGPSSCELCGGTHVKATGEIGVFRIVSEGSVGSGLRRIEAVAGKRALAFIQERENELQKASALLQSKPDELSVHIGKLLDQCKAMEKQLQAVQKDSAANEVKSLIQGAEMVNGTAIVVAKVNGVDAPALRNIGDQIRQKLQPVVVLLGTTKNGKVMFLSMVSQEIAGSKVHAGQLVKDAAAVCGGGGGGRPDMAQAGGRLPEKLDVALEKAKTSIAQALGQ